jgi:hypothetical protein
MLSLLQPRGRRTSCRPSCRGSGKLKLKTTASATEQAELECSLKQLHRTTLQPPEGGAEQAQRSQTSDAQEQSRLCQKKILTGALCT